MADTSKIIIKDESGEEKEMEIIFTFDDEANERSYVLFTDPNDEDGEVFACRYNDEFEMVPVEDEQEWIMIEEVFGAFVEEMDDYEQEEEKQA